MNMSLDALMDTLPPYAKDLKLNFSSVIRQQTDLSEQQLWGTVVACPMASRHQDLTATALEEAANYMTPQALEAAKGAAAIMGINNIFSRFLHLSSNQKQAAQRGGPGKNVIRPDVIDQLDF